MRVVLALRACTAVESGCLSFVRAGLIAALKSESLFGAEPKRSDGVESLFHALSSSTGAEKTGCQASDPVATSSEGAL